MPIIGQCVRLLFRRRSTGKVFIRQEEENYYYFKSIDGLFFFESHVSFK